MSCNRYRLEVRGMRPNGKGGVRGGKSVPKGVRRPGRMRGRKREIGVAPKNIFCGECQLRHLKRHRILHVFRLLRYGENWEIYRGEKCEEGEISGIVSGSSYPQFLPPSGTLFGL